MFPSDSDKTLIPKAHSKPSFTPQRDIMLSQLLGQRPGEYYNKEANIMYVLFSYTPCFSRAVMCFTSNVKFVARPFWRLLGLHRSAFTIVVCLRNAESGHTCEQAIHFRFFTKHCKGICLTLLCFSLRRWDVKQFRKSPKTAQILADSVSIAQKYCSEAYSACGSADHSQFDKAGIV